MNAEMISVEIRIRRIWLRVFSVYYPPGRDWDPKVILGPLGNGDGPDLNAKHRSCHSKLSNV
jgi:hypothetical protein